MSQDLATALPLMSVPVPAVLRGDWAVRNGAIAESCDLEFPDDFKSSFSANRRGFYYWEARGTPIKVRQTRPGRFVMDLAMAGEGSDWKERRTFTLVENGRSLIVNEAVSANGSRESRYVRCPGAVTPRGNVPAPTTVGPKQPQ